MRLYVRLSVPLFLVLLLGCNAPAPAGDHDARSVHPLSGLQVIPLTIAQNTVVYRFQVEVAQTDEEQEMGLMFRTAIGPNEGMLFPNRIPGPRSFWMKNTVIPLDILFIGRDHHVVNIAASAPPYSLAPIPSAGPVVAVLEINGGRAKELGIKRGAQIRW